MKRLRMKLHQTIINPRYDGILVKLYQSNEFDFLNDLELARTLNIEYYKSHSGLKYISNLYENLINDELSSFERVIVVDDENNDFIMIDNDYIGVDRVPDVLNDLSNIIIAKFKDKWIKSYNALMTNYKPLENYSMIEEETPDLVDTRTTKSKTKMKTTITNDKSGYNSSSYSPYDKSISELEGDDTNNVSEDKLTRTGKRTLERSGNIGVTTSQQKLISEIELRDRYIFIDMMFKDIDSILCLSIY